MSDSHIVLGAVEVLCARLELEGFDVAIASVRGPDKTENEDGALVRALGDGTLVAAVVDGMGGMRNGALAARRTIEAIDAALDQRAPDASRRAALVEGIERAHERVLLECQGGGATVVAAVFGEGRAQVVHSGDAEALVLGGGGKLRYRTVPHSPVGYAQAAGLLSEEEALHHPERHVVSSGVGVRGMEIQVGPRVQTRVRDSLLLASDGLFDNVLEHELLERTRRGDVESAARALVDLARTRMESGGDGVPGKPDDLTLVLARPRRA